MLRFCGAARLFSRGQRITSVSGRGRNRGKVRTWAAGQTQPEGRVPEIPTPRPERIQKYLDLKIDLHVPDC